MNERESVDSVARESISGKMSFEKMARILCLLVLFVFVWYLVGGLVGSLESVLQRVLSNRALNLDLKISLLFQISHLVCLPFVVYFLWRDIVYDISD